MPPTLQLRHLTIDDVGITYGVVAPSPSPLATLVWLHGLGGASTIQFAPFAGHPDLSDVTSILIDLPGFGQSAAAGDSNLEAGASIVAEVIRLVAEPPVVLFGHSMGGSIAILAAQALGDAVARLPSSARCEWACGATRRPRHSCAAWKWRHPSRCTGRPGRWCIRVHRRSARCSTAWRCRAHPSLARPAIRVSGPKVYPRSWFPMPGTS
jgi:predicted alpha/beta hydrolase